MDRPAELSPWGDLGWPVLLSPRGARMCRIALEQAASDAQKRHGGALPSDAFRWLLDVLRIAEKGTAVPMAATGHPVRVVLWGRDGEQGPDKRTESAGCAKGCGVAALDPQAALSALERSGRSFGTRAAAERLGISPQAVRKACVRGWLPAVRVRGGAWQIDADALAAYAERQQERSRHGAHQQQEGGPASPHG